MNQQQHLSLENGLVVGMREFLQIISHEDLHGIVKTTTGGLIAATSVEEAISVIVRYSDAVSLLNRRRIKREYLANYLYSKNLRIQFPTDKTTLCRLVLKHWGCQDGQSYYFTDMVHKRDEENKSVSKLPQATVPKSSQNLPQIKLEPCTVSNKITSSIGDATSSANSHTKLKSYSPTQTPANSPNPTPVPESESQGIMLPLRPSQDDNMDVDNSFHQSMIRQELQTGQELGVQFANWFYDRWNKLEDFGNHHFWPECNLRMEMIHNADQPRTCKEILFNGQQCFEEMYKLIFTEKLFFNPNVTDGLGVRGKINPHGLAQVMVCGSFHRGLNALGIFEQVFGLMRDPSAQNNYKIKFTVLRFREGSYLLGEHPPALCDSSLVEIIEEEDDD